MFIPDHSPGCFQKEWVIGEPLEVGSSEACPVELTSSMRGRRNFVKSENKGMNLAVVLHLNLVTS